MNAVVYMSILISISTISTKRCKGRVRTGSSCCPHCNYATGKWQRKLCAAAFIPPPDYPQCLTITGKECRLPFEYEGELVRTCTLKNSESTKPWCVTDVTGEQEDWLVGLLLFWSQMFIHLVQYFFLFYFSNFSLFLNLFLGSKDPL